MEGLHFPLYPVYD